MAGYAFHPKALAEFEDATTYYLDHASPMIAAAFVAEVETALREIQSSPAIWPILDDPDIRRFLLRRFPYAIYYLWTPETEDVFIYAIMHLRRQPGYWRDRLL